MARHQSIARTAAHVGLPFPRAETFAALAHRDFRLLLIGNMFTQLGQWTQQVGKGWLVYTLTGSPFQLGLVAFCNGAGMFVGAPIGGALADRFDRQKMMLVSQVSLMVIALVLAFLVFTDTIRIWHTYVTAFASGWFFAMNGPARQSLVHDIVGKRDLVNAIALNTVTMNSMRVLGPSLGGLLIATVGIEGTFFLQAGGYAGSLLAVLLMQAVTSPQPEARSAFFRSILDGANYARKDRTLATLLTIAFVSGLLGMVYMQLLPAYVGDVLHKDRGSVLGFLMTAGGVGGLLGAMGVAVMGDFRWKGRLLLTAVAATGLLQMGLGAFGHLEVAIFLLAGLGMANAITLTMNNSLIQTHVADHYRGRVMSLHFLTFSLQPLGVLVGGRIAEAIGLEPALLLLGGLVAGAMLGIAALSPRIHRL